MPFVSIGISELLENHSSNNSPFRVLSVGSGEGENDINILKAFSKIGREKQKAISIINRVIEPDVGRLWKFRAKTANLFENLTEQINVDFEWVPMTFQEYTSQKKEDDAKFDVVHFIHSMYYLGIEDALVHCYEKVLGKEGIIISITQDEDDPMLKLAAKFPNQRNPSLPRNKDVIALATQRRWKYFACPVNTNNLDITAIFDSSSWEGNYLLDFLINERKKQFKTS